MKWRLIDKHHQFTTQYFLSFKYIIFVCVLGAIFALKLVLFAFMHDDVKSYWWYAITAGKKIWKKCNLRKGYTVFLKDRNQWCFEKKIMQWSRRGHIGTCKIFKWSCKWLLWLNGFYFHYLWPKHYHFYKEKLIPIPRLPI